MAGQQAVRETRAERSARTREELVITAGQVFREHGYHATSLDRIAETAGYTKGAVYSNFSSKADLFFRVWDQEVKRRFHELLHALEMGGVPQAAKRYIRLIDEDLAWSALLVEFTAHAVRHEDLRARLAERNRALMARLSGLDALHGLASTESRAARTFAAAVLVVASGLIVERMIDPDALAGDIAETLVTRLLESAGSGR